MSQRPFSPALAFKLPNNGVYVADSVWELEQYLDLFWPSDDDERARLLRLCCDSLDGWVPAEKIRAQAETAASRMGLLVCERPEAGLKYRAVDQDWQKLNA